MKGSLIVFVCFVVGVVAGRFVEIDVDVHVFSLLLLYLLMVQVGLGIGSNPSIVKIIKNLGWRDLLLPIGTVGGSLIISAITGLFLKNLTLMNVLAINYSCGYYSLSSIMINQLLTSESGAIVASGVATIALMANIFRELMALIFAPMIESRFGSYALIGAAGVTSTDVCLPSIRKWSGDSFTGIAILHGVLIDISTPFFITLFCEI